MAIVFPGTEKAMPSQGHPCIWSKFESRKYGIIAEVACRLSVHMKMHEATQWDLPRLSRKNGDRNTQMYIW
jgi:hypothetical protein